VAADHRPGRVDLGSEVKSRTSITAYERNFMIRIDLHMHSTASDGVLSPTQVVQLAKERGLTTIALTGGNGHPVGVQKKSKFQMNGIRGR
jgi:DNA polymerase III alpha subunit (gram-positive type)